jgi:hypothetical protein
MRLLDLRPFCLTLLITAFLFISGCRRERVPRTAAASDTVTAAASGAETFFRYGLTGVAHSRQALRDSLGAPDSISSKPVVNRHDKSQTDSIITLHYPDLDADIYHVSANGNEFLFSLSVRNAKYIAPNAPISIGMSASDLQDVMGTPTDSAGGVLTYLCATCTTLGTERIEVKTTGGKVSAVTIFYSFD